MTVRYTDRNLFTRDPDQPWAQAPVVDGERISYVGSSAGAREYAPDAVEVGLDGATVLPGSVDGHTHLLMAGDAQLWAHLTDARDLDGIRRRLRTWAEENPDAPRVLGRG